MSVETRMSADAEESLMKPVGVKKAFCLIRVAVRKERKLEPVLSQYKSDSDACASFLRPLYFFTFITVVVNEGQQGI